MTGSKLSRSSKYAAHHTPDFGEVALGNPAEGGKRIEHSIIGKPVMHEFSFTPVRNETAAQHLLKML